jgi:16S rRNA (guanine527-N7)-methyltransferase
VIALAGGGAGAPYDRAAFEREFGVSRETSERVETHRRLLGEWSERMNLVGPKELDLFWGRHSRDSAQLLALAPGAKRWVDLGSGAGFPGLIVAAMLAGAPGAEVHLLESTAKKARFLNAVIEAASLPARVFAQRIEDFGAGTERYEVVTARALAPLPRLIAYASPLLARGAQGLFHKGADVDAELTAAKDALEGGGLRAEVLESISDPRGRIVRIAKAA